MEFNQNKAIYLQIRDTICERILSGDLKPEDRIPSVREYICYIFALQIL